MDFRAHPEGIAFQFLGTPHLVALAAVLAVNLSFIPMRGRLGETGRRVVRYGLAAAVVGMEVAYRAWRLRAGLWNVREDLSLLHLCGLMNVASAAVLVSRNQRLYELVYFLGIGGALQALLTPDVAEYGYPHLRFYTSFVTHGCIVAAGVYLTVVEGFRPTWASVRRVAVFMLAFMALVGGANALLGSNYMFIARKPPFPSLLDGLGPWPWYIGALIGMGFVIVLLLHLPFAVAEWRARGEPHLGAAQRRAPLTPSQSGPPSPAIPGEDHGRTR